jgi:hypothetical protein
MRNAIFTTVKFQYLAASATDEDTSLQPGPRSIIISFFL